MSDERIEWRGHPSQWRNAGWFAACVLVLPIPIALWKWLETRNTQYTLTDERLTFSRGILTKTTSSIRFKTNVRDERMVGLGNIELFTTDETSPTVRLPFIPDAEAVREKIRALVEARRDAKRVRYLDTE